MEQITENETKTGFPWVELIIYLVGGMGAYVLASYGASFLIHKESVWVVLIVALLSLATLGGSFFYLGVLRRKTSPQEAGILPISFKWYWIPLAIGISLALIPVRGVIGLLASLLIEGGLESLQNRADLLMGSSMEFSWLGFLITFISIGIIVPISEELFFRGLLHNFFKKHLGFWPRIFLSSAIFGACHYDSIAVVVSSFIMGLVIAYAYEKTKSLWMAFFLHSSTNGIAAILMYVALYLGETFQYTM